MRFYEKTLMFRRGVRVSIDLLFPCNLSCPYCVLEIPTKHRPKSKQMNLEAWKEIINTFPTKISQVYVSGGEPTMVKWMPEFVNWLLHEKGFHVMLFTNLFRPEDILKIKNSYRFQIVAALHDVEGENAVRFDSAYQKIKDKYNVMVIEFTDKPQVPYSVHSKFITEKEMNEPKFFYSPDGDLYTNYYKAYEEKSAILDEMRLK